MYGLQHTAAGPLVTSCIWFQTASKLILLVQDLLFCFTYGLCFKISIWRSDR